MTGLNIAPGIVLPIDLVTEPIGVLANRGRGKSYSTHVLVEEIHTAGVPVVVLDVKGDWWGVRSSADGRSEGMPFYIFGGDHADLPLEPTAGDLLADLVVDERVSVVLDLSHLSKTKARTFTTAFAERLYHRNRDPLFLVVDEADVLIPQRATADTARLLGAMEDLAKRGRGRGIGMAVVTQRPQEVAKSVLDLMETLLLFGMTGPRALDRVKEWISVHVDETHTPAEVMASLPSLPVGEAWLWSPMRQILQRIHVRPMRTFDSHPTPKVGETRQTPKTRSALDLAALGDRIAATVERAKADDPRALRARIRDLEQQLATAQAVEPPTPEPIHVPAVTAEVLSDLTAATTPLLEVLTLIRDELAAAARPAAPQTPLPGRTQPAAARLTQPTAPPRAERTAPRGSASTAGQGTDLPKAQRLILTVLVQHGPRTKTQVAVLTAYSHKGGGFNNSLSSLRTAGYIEGRDTLAATQAGIDALGAWDPLPTGRALLDWWKANHLGKAEKAIVDSLDAFGGGPVDKATLAEHAGYEPTGGGFNNALSRLRGFDIIEGRADIALNPELVG